MNITLSRLVALLAALALATHTRAQTHTYDAAGRLTRTTYAGSAVIYAYDKAGNLTSVSRPVALATSPTSYADLGGTGAVSITPATAATDWSVTADSAWVTLTSSATGRGDATLGYRLAANTSTKPRTATLTVLGERITLTQAGSRTRLVNLSTRGVAGTGDNIMIAGFVVVGTTPKPMLIRGIGPALAGFGVPGTLADPQLALFNSAGKLTENNDWSTATNSPDIISAAQRLGAFALSAGSRDASLLATLPPGPYTAQLSGVGATTGVSLIEVYDASEAGTSPEVFRPINISFRGAVGTGDNVLIAGFVVGGQAPKQVLVRGIGPALAVFGVPGILADPTLKVVKDGATVAENDSWGVGPNSSAAALIAASAGAGAFALPASSRDAAVLVTLAPGSYTAIVSGVGGTTGVALVEVYEIDL